MVDKKSLDFLPKTFQTNTNRRFLNATVDQLIQEPNLGRVYGYIGRQDLSPAYREGDAYVQELDSYSQYYQLEPGLVINRRIANTENFKKSNAYNYVDLLNGIATAGGINTDHSRLFANEYYNYEGFVELDKLINYGKYYWMPNGPKTVDVTGSGLPLSASFSIRRPLESDVVSTALINKNIGEVGYSIDAYPAHVNPTITLVRGGSYSFNVAQTGHPFWIQTEPGLNPGTAYQDNIIKREVFGVGNNGAESGVITFNVPQTNAQYFYESMPVYDSVDLVTDLPFSEMQNANYGEFTKKYNIDGLKAFTIKTLVLTNEQDDYWYEPDIFGGSRATSITVYEGGSPDVNSTVDGSYNPISLDYDNDSYDRGLVIPPEKRKGIWQIANVEGKVKLTYLKDWPVNTKIFVREGRQYGHLDIFKDNLLNIYKVPHITASISILYYQDGVDPGVYGEIRLVDPEPNTSINVESILGQSHYTSPNGVIFTSGLKVKFTGSVYPDSYLDKEYIVEGVGKDITLTEWDMLISADPNNPNQGDGFGADSETYDSISYDLNLNAPIRKDYVVINRACVDGNAWSRTNRWFHEDVIRYAGTFADPYASVELDNNYRGIRPIIEFDSNLQLWNYGNKFIRPVTVIDTNIIDASNEVEGRSPYVILDENGNYFTDHVALEDGTSVVFVNEEYENVRNKIFEVKNINPHTTNTLVKLLTHDAGIESTELKFDTYVDISVGMSVIGAGIPTGTYVVSVNLDPTTLKNNSITISDALTNQIAKDSIISFGNDIVSINFNSYKTTTTFTPIGSKTLSFNLITDLFVNMKLVGDGIDPNTVIMSIDYDRKTLTINKATTADIANGSIIGFNNSVPQVHLIPIHTMSQGESVLAISGIDRQNTMYWWNNGYWKQAQQKFSLNQTPLFDVFNLDGISWGNTEYFPSSSFAGCKLFGYKEGLGTQDKELGFPLSYRSIGNIGDIVFQNFYDTDIFHFNYQNKDQTLNVGNGYVHEINPMDFSFKLRNNWIKVEDLSKQYIQRKFKATQNKVNNFPLDIEFVNSLTEKNFFVYVNGNEVSRNNFVLLGNSTSSSIKFNYDLLVDDVLVIKIFGKPTNLKETYTIPKNLVDNSQNDSFETLTLGQLRNHLQEIADNSLDFSGRASGSNNLRDIDYKIIPGKILQHSAGVHLAMLMFNNETTNIIKAIDFSRRSYNRFKDRFFYLISTMEFPNVDNPRACVDAVMEEITLNASNEQAFFYTDMIPYGNNTFISNEYQIYDTNYRKFNLITPYDINYPTYKSVLVYLNDSILLVGDDYTNDGSVVELNSTLALNINDTVNIFEYESTMGSMIPATPTKLGLYPKFKPMLFSDNTYVGTTKNVIIGHDGSNIIAFNDYRDQIIIEYEKRVYNNINVEFVNDPRTSYTGIEPGAFRNSDYDIDEWTQLLSGSFLNWAGSNNINIFLNDATQNDPFSFNYGQGVDKLFGEGLPGYWRAIYKYFYDTDRPHTHPWEMLGFPNRPSWWELRYGPAPYTSGNLVLWKDMELGVVYQHGKDSYIDSRYARPGLSNIIPVNVHGELLPPTQVIVTNWNQATANATWRFGDQSPQETAWRRSSDYPFALQTAWAMARPAQYCNLSLNRRDLVRLIGLDQIINRKTGNRKLNLLVTDETQYIPGSNVWIRDRLSDLSLDITENFIEIFKNFKINLLYKSSSYTDKSYLQIIADQSSPNSTNTGILIPQDNYEVLLTKSAPVTEATYSAVIIQKSETGFAVYGFDNVRPYFTIIPRRYNNNYYNIKVSNSSALIYEDDDNNIQTIPYGTQLSTRQQVVDFLISYGKHLTSIGFQFNDITSVDTASNISDWTLAVKEFLYWIEQGWDNNTIISLTPAGTKVSFDSGYGVVDEITNSFNGSRVLDSNGIALQSKDYATFRSGTSFELRVKDPTVGIHLLDISVVQYEHTLVFDNTTMFNDVIYEPNLGNRQYRMKITGFKTRDWDGSLYAPGFLINHKSVDQWVAVKDYYKGDVVLYKNLYYTARNFIPGEPQFDSNHWYEIDGTLLQKQLIPNLAFNAQQFENFYDVDTFDVNRNADMAARNSTGFTRRQYLSDIGLDDISQHKFYLGMIREKGTQAAVNAFLRVKLPYLDNKVQVDEQWAIRLSNYGGLNQKQDIELSLSGTTPLNGTYIIQLLNEDDARDDRWNTFKPKDLLIKPANYDANLFTATEKNPLLVGQTGPVMINEVDTTLFDILKIYNINSLSTILGEGSRIWVASDRNNEWNVYRITADKTIFVIYSTVIGKEIEFTTNVPHGLSPNTHVLIKNGSVNGTNLGGFYRITAVGNNSFRAPIYPNANSATGSMNGILFQLKSVRYTNRAGLGIVAPGRGWINNDRVWIDGLANNYQVLSNTSKWKENQSLTPVFSYQSDKFGNGIDIKTSQDIMVVGAPNRNSVYQLVNACRFVATGFSNVFTLNALYTNPAVYVNGVATLNYTIVGTTLTIFSVLNSHDVVTVQDYNYAVNGRGKVYVYRVDDNQTWGVIEGVEPDDNSVSGFGYSVKYNDLDLVAVGAPYSLKNAGLAYVMTTTTNNVGINQVISANNLNSSDNFGQCVTTSTDGKWLAVAAPANNKVYVYQLTDIATTVSAGATGAQLNQPLPTAALGKNLTANDVTVKLNSKVLVPYVDYTLNDSFILAARAYLAEEYRWIDAVVLTHMPKGETLGSNTAATGSLGTNIITTSGTQSGTFVVNQLLSGIGIPSATYIINVTGTSPNFTLTLNNNLTSNFNGGISATVAGDYIEVSYGTYYKYITSFQNPEVSGNFGYSMSFAEDGTQLVIGSPNLTQTINGTSYANMGAAYVYERTVEKFIASGSTASFTLENTPNSPTVYVDGVQTKNYTINSLTLTLSTVPSKDSIIEIETNNFVLLETKKALVPQDGLRFGTKITLCPTTCSLYVGAPGYNNLANSNGAVFRYVNAARLYGFIGSSNLVNYTAVGDSLRINGVKVTFTGTNASSAAKDINNANIPGVSASVAASNYNMLTINSDSRLAYKKLIINTTVANSALTTLGLNIFDLYQTITANTDQNTSDFGSQIALDRTATKLLIGSSLATNKVSVTFDSTRTTFDSNSSKFLEIYYRSGTGYLYEYQSDEYESSATHGNFAFAQSISTNSLQTNDYFTTGIVISKNWMMVTALNGRNSSGTVYTYYNKTGKSNWDVVREQAKKVDTRKIERLYLYDDNTRTLTVDLPIIDPEHGLPVRSAVEQIRYTVNYDPAIYTNTPNNYSFAVDQKKAWGKEHVGELWWDTNSIKYVDWNQGDIFDRLNTWGLSFPNSYVSVYEWVESNTPPKDYSKTHSSSPVYTVSDVYTQQYHVDPQTLQTYVKYYFWVKNSNSNDSMKRRDSALSIQNLIANPRNANEPFAAILDTNTIALFNCQNFINNDTRMHIAVNKFRQVNPIHEEWSMFDDGTDLGIATEFLDRLNDSLAGEDVNGRVVPDQNLTEKEKYGLGIRPRQTTFVNKFTARKTWIDNVNAVMIKYPMALLRNISSLKDYDPSPVVDFRDIRDAHFDPAISIKFQVDYDSDLEYYNKAFYVGRGTVSNSSQGTRALVLNDSATGGWTIRELTTDPANENNLIWDIVKVQTYDIRNYWTYTDWYATHYGPNTVVSKILDYEYQISASNPQVGDVIKIKNSNEGSWKLVLVNLDNLELIGQQNATIQLSSKLYDNIASGFGIDSQSFEVSPYAKDAAIELRYLFNIVNYQLLIKELRDEYKNVIKIMIDNIATQFKQNDWILKTSLINIKHRVRALDEIPVYVKQPEDIITGFINEVKPYHTKIKQYISSYDKTDLTALDVVDFDLPAYFNKDISKYRQPQLGNVVDELAISNAIYQPWLKNHTYSIQYIDINSGGTGYTSSTNIVIDGDGVGASADAFVRGGAITFIKVTNPGHGYTYANIKLVGVGSGATAFAKLSNSTARTFNSTVKFDRITYTPAKNYDQYDAGTTLFDNNNTRFADSATVVREWKPNTIYGSGDILTYNRSVYRPAVPLYTTGETFTLDYLIELVVRTWQPNSSFSKDTIIVYNNRAYVALTDFTSSRYFEYNANIIASNSQTWQSSHAYKVNDLISYNGASYQVAKDFTSPVTFNETNLLRIYDIAIYPGGYLNDAASRIQAYYSPGPGMPGRDLAQLMTGIEYPGVTVTGAGFDQSPGFGFGLYEQVTYDTRTYDENGLAEVYGSQKLDSNYYSLFKDSQLGIRPEDMIIDGSAYVSPETSHAPEELVPGHIFDSLNIHVKTLSNNIVTGSPELVMISPYADNFTTVFSFNPVFSGTKSPKGGIEGITIVMDIDGPQIEGVHYDINWQDQYVEFYNPPMAPNSIFITLWGASGQNIVADAQFIGDGVQTEYELFDITLNNVKQAYVKVNGVKAEDWILVRNTESSTWLPITSYRKDDYIVYNNFTYRVVNDFRSGKVFDTKNLMAANRVIVRFDNPPVFDAKIQVHLYNLPIESKAYSEIISHQYTVSEDQMGRPEGYVLIAPENIQYKQPWEAMITVDINGTSLEPSNQAYYIGNNSARKYSLPIYRTIADVNKISDSDILVVVNGVTLYNRVDYVINRNGVDIPSVTLTKAPASGASVTISNKSEAKFVIYENNQIIIKPSVPLSVGDKINVTVYSNHDQMDIHTEVFSGATSSTNSLYLGFDMLGFESQPFEIEKTNFLTAPTYYLGRSVKNLDNIRITLNGSWLDPYYDFVLIAPTILRIDPAFSISSDDLIIVTHISESTRDTNIEYRIFKSQTETYDYLGIGTSTKTRLTQDLAINDEWIYVENTDVLSQPDPTRATPGVVFVNGERITFYIVDFINQRVGQLRRATNGTGAPALSPVGTIVYDGGYQVEIPNSRDSYITTKSALSVTKTSVKGDLNSTFITMNDTSGITKGMEVTGSGIANRTTVISVDSSTQLTLSVPNIGVVGGVATTGIVTFTEVAYSTQTILVGKTGNQISVPAGSLIRQGTTWLNPGIAKATDGRGISGSTTIQANFLRAL